MLTLALMQRLWPRGNSKVPGLIEGIVAAAPTVLPAYGINDDLTLAHAMAQFSHECGAGTEMEENINYTASRAVQVWPSRFKSAEDCYAKVGSFAGDPDFKIKLIDNVYGNRMGNRPGTHDGSSFIGRGLAQTTGRSSYAELGRILNLPLVDQPQLVCDPAHALAAGVADLVQMCGCLPFMQRDDLNQVTRRLNGGYIGLAERAAWLKRWKAALSEGYVAVPNVPADGLPADHEHAAVMALQRALIAEGFDPGAPDGMMGPKTVKAFQLSRGLTADGIVGPKTKPLLDEALSNLS